MIFKTFMVKCTQFSMRCKFHHLARYTGATDRKTRGNNQAVVLGEIITSIIF